MALPAVYLLDIEGTTSSISFVHEVLFPFARKHMAGFLHSNWGTPDVSAAVKLMTGDDPATPQSATTIALQLMDADAKQTGLKLLQGMIWKQGYTTGELVSHVYPDTPAAMVRFRERGAKVCIYSSGSVEAQRQFFAFTGMGSLSDLIDGYFDTTVGPKREQRSYEAIVAKLGISAGEVAFYSDIPQELDAARSAGMRTTLVVRPGSTAKSDQHRTICDFTQE